MFIIKIKDANMNNNYSTNPYKKVKEMENNLKLGVYSYAIDMLKNQGYQYMRRCIINTASFKELFKTVDALSIEEREKQLLIVSTLEKKYNKVAEEISKGTVDLSDYYSD